VQVDTSSAQLAHDQPAIEYCFKPALEYKAAGQSAGRAVLNILSTLREVADSAQVCVVPATAGAMHCSAWQHEIDLCLVKLVLHLYHSPAGKAVRGLHQSMPSRSAAAAWSCLMCCPCEFLDAVLHTVPSTQLVTCQAPASRVMFQASKSCAVPCHGVPVKT